LKHLRIRNHGGAFLSYKKTAGILEACRHQSREALGVWIVFRLHFNLPITPLPPYNPLTDKRKKHDATRNQHNPIGIPNFIGTNSNAVGYAVGGNILSGNILSR
jgi:hypothetical protein